MTTTSRGGRLIDDSGSSEYTDTFTRPADTTQYSLNDRIAATTSDTATTVLRSLKLAKYPGKPFMLTYLGIRTNLDTFICTIRMHFYRVNAPTTAVAGDNAAFSRVYANVDQHIGTWDLPALVDVGDFATASSADIRLELAPAGGDGTETTDDKVYYALEIVSGTPTPASGQSFTVVARSVDLD